MNTRHDETKHEEWCAVGMALPCDCRPTEQKCKCIEGGNPTHIQCRKPTRCCCHPAGDKCSCADCPSYFVAPNPAPTPKDTREEKRTVFQCQARGCDGCTVCKDAFTPPTDLKELREELKKVFYRHFDKHGYDGVDATFSDIESFITAKIEEARNEDGDKATIHYEKICKDQLEQAKQQWIERVREWADEQMETGTSAKQNWIKGADLLTFLDTMNSESPSDNNQKSV